METEIRKATIEDSAAIISIIEELAKFERDADADIVSQIDNEKHDPQKLAKNPSFFSIR